MKKSQKTKTLIIVGSIIVFIIIASFVYIKLKENENTKPSPKTEINETTVDYYTLEKELNIQNVKMTKTGIYEKILEYGEYNATPIYLKNNVLYGDYISKEIMNIIMVTKGIWSFDLETKDFKYYEYPDKHRIWEYYIENDNIYYIELREDFENNAFKWSLIKSDLEFKNKTYIESGKIVSVMNDAPAIRIDDVTGKVYLYTVNDEITTDGKSSQSTFKISLLENDKLKTIIQNSGSHTNKKGVFSCQATYTFNVHNNELMYCEVSYYDKEKIKVLDLTTQKTITVYENNDLDNWQISEAHIGNNVYYITQISKDSNYYGKIIYTPKDLSTTNIVNANGYKISRVINDDNFVINSNLSYTIFSTKDKSYKNKLNINTRDYAPYYISDGKNTLILENTDDNDFYIVTIE